MRHRVVVVIVVKPDRSSRPVRFDRVMAALSERYLEGVSESGW